MGLQKESINSQSWGKTVTLLSETNRGQKIGKIRILPQ